MEEARQPKAHENHTCDDRDILYGVVLPARLMNSILTTRYISTVSLVITLMETQMRTNEVIALHVEDIDFAVGTIKACRGISKARAAR